MKGDVYQKIIEDVISASATDFEESGVSQATLQELQQVSLSTFFVCATSGASSLYLFIFDLFLFSFEGKSHP